MTSAANLRASTDLTPVDTDGRRFREEIDRLISDRAAAEATRRLGDLWRSDPSTATASFIVSRYETLRPQTRLLPYRLAVLRSFTVEPIVSMLRAGAFVSGIDLQVQLGGFNTFVQEILDSASSLYAFNPDAVILAVGTQDIAPELWFSYADLDGAAVEILVERLVGDYRSWISAFRQSSQAHLIIHGLECSLLPSLGTLDSQRKDTQADTIATINQRLRSLASEHPGIFVVDYDGLVAAHGRFSWRDERKQHAVRLPIATRHLRHMAAEWLRFLHPLSGKVAKVAVVDLDNTLWGGVIGEDGIAGIRLGPEYPGIEYYRLQRVLLDLSCRGILLAVSSKNNLDDALEVIDRHPAMLLRRQHFAALRIDWNDKTRHLREIAAELNVGLDALAFLDDNPAERDRVRAELPDVFVLDLPADPMNFAQAVQENPVFQRLTISSEDRERSRHYSAQQDRAQLERSATTPEDFYRSLRQEVIIERVSRTTVARVAQLTQKTNQFNLTTRRYTEQQLTALMTDPEWSIFAMRVRDCYGDNGIVGVAMLHYPGDNCELDTLLLSCRVIGRTVETALFVRLLRDCRERSAKTLQGWFRPSQKNAPARDFYRAHGFQIAEDFDTGTLWRLDVASSKVSTPAWILVADAGGSPVADSR